MNAGIEEYELPSRARVDCYIPNKYVCELDFANKIYEMFGQLAWYSLETGLKGKGVIILDKKYEKKQMYYVEKARKMAEAYGFEIEVITDDILNLDENGKCPYKDCKCNKNKGD
ncbi:MAG: hypothetical protein IJS47_04865 [Clostridia bacterium]|nr:hypothetical protein [Clostridia bacterium]